MSADKQPVVLELAPLPREQIGPFLLLGVDKDADAEQVEANWAKRVIWARKQQTRLALEDINWAREVIHDPVRRLRADTVSLNVDTSDGTLRRLAQRYTVASWQPLDQESPPALSLAPVQVPDAGAVQAAIGAPGEVWAFPAVDGLLDDLIGNGTDPWEMMEPQAGDPGL
jgi:hypothetical protein